MPANTLMLRRGAQCSEHLSTSQLSARYPILARAIET